MMPHANATSPRMSAQASHAMTTSPVPGGNGSLISWRPLEWEIRKIGDVLDILDLGWDLMIAHPPCTHLAVSRALYFSKKQREQEEALEFVRLLMDAPNTPDRGRKRSVTFSNIAAAMAYQWTTERVPYDPPVTQKLRGT